MWPLKTSYALLPADNDSSISDTDEATEKSTKEYRVGASRAHMVVLYIFSIALAGALCVIIILYIDVLEQLKAFQPVRPLVCGNTIKEAEANGCIFDLLTKVWLPSACTRHGEPNFMKIATGNNETQWPYWADKDGRQALTVEQVSRMADTEEEWWTTTREHITSCSWMTIRMAHAYTTGERVDNLARSFHHIRHCTLLTLGWAYRAPAKELDQMYKTLGGSKTGFGTC
jgi:hypothetical protein